MKSNLTLSDKYFLSRVKLKGYKQSVRFFVQGILRPVAIWMLSLLRNLLSSYRVDSVLGSGSGIMNVMLNKAQSAPIEGKTYFHRIPMWRGLWGYSHAHANCYCLLQKTVGYTSSIDHMGIITLIFLDFLVAFCTFWFQLRWSSLIGNAHRPCILAIEVVFLYPLLMQPC